MTTKLEEFLWQDWRTYAGAAMAATLAYEMPIPASEYLDLGESVANVLLRFNIAELRPLAAGVTPELVVESGPDESGPWRELRRTRVVGDMELLFSGMVTQGAEGPDRLIRTRIDSPNVPWVSTYRATAEAPGDCGCGTSPTGGGTGGQPFSEWIPWNSIRGNGSGAPVTLVTDASQYWQTRGLERALVQVEASLLSGATIHIQGAFGQEGPWLGVLTVGATTNYVLASTGLDVEEDPGRPLYPWLR